MRLRYKIGLIVIAVSLAVCLMTFQSYALWVKDIVAENDNVVEVGCFSIKFEDNSSNISLQNTYPVSDTKGLQGTPYTFTITNICTIDDSYIVTLNTSTENQKGEKDGQFTPTEGNSVPSYNMKDKVKFALSEATGKEEKDSNPPKSGENLGTYAAKEGKLNQDTTELTNVENLDESIILDTGILKGKQANQENGDSITYHLYLWFDQTAGNEIMDQTFKASVNIIHHATYAKDELQGDEPREDESQLPQDVLDNVIHEDEQDQGGGHPITTETDSTR